MAMFIWAWIVVLFIPFVLELIRLLGKQYDRHIKTRYAGKQIRQTFWQQSVRTIIFAAQLGTAYILMMIAMTFNG